MVSRNLILTGGIRHDFGDVAAGLASLLEKHGIASDLSFDIEDGLNHLQVKRHDLVTVHALRWRMLEGEKYAPLRDAWSFQLSPSGREILRNHVLTGGGLLAMHTACICFDDWAEWRELIGCAWVWGRSSHPPFGPVHVEPTSNTHPITEGYREFHLNDEVFSDLAVDADVLPLLSASAMMPGGNLAVSQPVFWARTVGLGRVVFDALGHDRASIEHPMHASLIARAACWAGNATVLPEQLGPLSF